MSLAFNVWFWCVRFCVSGSSIYQKLILYAHKNSLGDEMGDDEIGCNKNVAKTTKPNYINLQSDEFFFFFLEAYNSFHFNLFFFFFSAHGIIEQERLLIFSFRSEKIIINMATLYFAIHDQTLYLLYLTLIICKSIIDIFFFYISLLIIIELP